MTREYITNFATTSLVSPSPLTSGGTSFVVTSTQGALFPVANFEVTIDSEILFISSRSGDTFTIGTRGYDGTVAASHTVGVTIQLSVSAQHFNHLWSCVPDTYTPSAAPANQVPVLTPSIWDNEFESTGGWTLYPSSPGTGSTWNAGSSLRSYLLMDRSSSDNATYYAYIAFSPAASTPFIITAKLSASINFSQTVNTNNQLQTTLFATDQSNPTSGSPTNRFFVRAQYLTNVNTSGASYFATAYNYSYACQVFGGYNISGGGTTSLTPLITPSIGQTLFLRIAFDGSSTYTAYIGDGWVYWPIGQKGSLGFTPQCMGVVFSNYIGSGSGFSGTQAIDYVRVVTGSANPRYGN